jgi:GTP cyclohydrolase I
MRSLTDTQNEKDDRNIPIDRVGVKNLRIPVQVPLQSGGLQHTIATVALAVDLPADCKGTHMSRFVEVLNTHGTNLDLSSIHALPHELLTRLQATSAYITYQFPFFLKKLAPISNGESFMDYEVRFDIHAALARETEFTMTVLVPVTTLCPCSKAISKRGAHNQRGLVTYSVRSRDAITIEELIALVEHSASCELYSLLKRVDEKHVTEKAYDNPVFVEDLVRNVATQTKEMKSISWFRVEAENFESIHNHNAYAMIEFHQA